MAMSSSHTFISICTLLVTLKLAGQNPVVKTRLGYIKGVSENGIAVFKGIPYAQPPVGSLRYQPPVSPQPWSDTLHAGRFSPASMQTSGIGITGSEDCLYLNLYIPQMDSRKNAVVIWVQEVYDDKHFPSAVFVIK